MKWLLLPTVSAPMPFQMVLDELLFDHQKQAPQEPVLRFYLSSEPWISVGCSYRRDKDLMKSELIRKNPCIPVCRRITGGGCVLHGRDLIFSLITCYEGEESGAFLSSAPTSYGKIHEGVKIAFQTLGLETRAYECGEHLPAGDDCFQFPVASDLAVNDEKVAGGAQKRSHGVLLHQESVRIPPGSEWGRLARSICRGFEHVFDVSIQAIDFDPEIYFQAEKLAKDKRLTTVDGR